MLAWLSVNLVNIVLIAVITLIVVLLIHGMLQDRKAGKRSCGGNCAGCGACSGCSSCGKCSAMNAAAHSGSKPEG